MLNPKGKPFIPYSKFQLSSSVRYASFVLLPYLCNLFCLSPSFKRNSPGKRLNPNAVMFCPCTPSIELNPNVTPSYTFYPCTPSNATPFIHVHLR